MLVTTAAEPALSMPNIPSPISALLAILRAYGGDIQGRGGENPRNGKDLAKVGALEGETNPELMKLSNNKGDEGPPDRR